jgi:hypothetical protein
MRCDCRFDQGRTVSDWDRRYFSTIAILKNKMDE